MIKKYVAKYDVVFYIGDDGSIYSEKKELLTPHPDKVGYMGIVRRDKNGIPHKYLVHRLVAAAFIGDVEGKQVHHINMVIDDNRVENLQICTVKEHMTIHKTKHPKFRTCVICGKIFEPKPTKRNRTKTCSSECASILIKREAAKRKRAINQIDIQTNKIIKRWDSARDAQNETGFYESNINKCCNHNIKTYKGYRWEYANE